MNVMSPPKQTPTTANHFFGFYDICPWDAHDCELLTLRYDRDYPRPPGIGDVAEVCRWHPDTGTVTAVGTTTAWNFQQGSRVRWLRNGHILYNDRDNDRCCAREVTASGRLVRTIAMGVYALSPDEKSALSPSFGRLGRYYPAYGYSDVNAPSIGLPHPDDDGLWHIDMITGEASLMMKLSDLAEETRTSLSVMQFISHPAYSRDGSYINFAHTFITSDGALFQRLMVARSDGTQLRCVASEKASHPCWIDDTTLAVWTRHSRIMRAARARDGLRYPWLRAAIRLARRWQGPLRNAMLAEGLYRVPVDGSVSRRRMGRDVINEDGHFSLHPHEDVLLADTYPDAARRQVVYLFHLGTGARVDVATDTNGVVHADRVLNCDLHPRWNRAGNRIAVDVCQNGTRRLCVIDAEDALARLLSMRVST